MYKSLRECSCTGCGLTFASTSAFETHRVGTYEPNNRRCLAEDTLAAHGLLQQNGIWRLAKSQPTILYRRDQVTLSGNRAS
jgi:hypothetical protein